MSQLLSGTAAIAAMNRMRSQSLDSIRRAKAKRRNVGAAWNERQRSVQGNANVLSLPPKRTTGETMLQPGSVEGRVPAGNGGYTPNQGVPLRSTPNLCSGRERFLSEIQTIPLSSSATFSLETPGAFCPKYMYISSSEPLAELKITSIESGLEKQIISGQVCAEYFSTENICCPVACFPCLCMPGVPLEVTIENTGPQDAEVAVGLVGDYYRVCPPNADQLVQDMRKACGNDKLIGFEAAISDGATVDFALETPGKFCPSNLFLVMSSTEGVYLSIVEVGLDNQVIKDGFPIAAFTNENETCCLPFCVPCLCMPGVTLNLSFTQTAAGLGLQTICGVIQGAYSPAC